MPDGSDDPGADLVDMLMDTSWVWSQYDHQLFLNTVEGPGGDATVLRLRHPVTGADTGPRSGADHRRQPRLVRGRSPAGNGADGGRIRAQPGLCGGPAVGRRELPQLRQSRPIPRSCGSSRKPSTACPRPAGPSASRSSVATSASTTSLAGPTSIPARSSGCWDWSTASIRRPPGVGLVDGGRLVLVGVTQAELSGSLWARGRGHRGGRLPDLGRGQAPGRGRRRGARWSSGGLLDGVHDVASGGVGVALAEMAVRSGVGLHRRPTALPRRPVRRVARREWCCASTLTA